MNSVKPIGTKTKIKQYLNKNGNGELLVYSDFASCGSYPSIRDAVVELCRDKVLNRVAQGIYAKATTEYSLSDIVMAICRKNKCKGVIVSDSIKDDLRIIKIHTTGSSRTMMLDDNCVLKFIHVVKL